MKTITKNMVCSLVQELVRELAFKMTVLPASVLEHKTSKNRPRRPDPQGKTGLIKDRFQPPQHTHTLTPLPKEVADASGFMPCVFEGQTLTRNENMFIRMSHPALVGEGALIQGQTAALVNS